jgi:spore maturation protein SpmA
MNAVFFAIIAIAFAVAGWHQLQLPAGAVEAPMEALGSGAVKAAEGAVSLGLGLIGSMALFLGLLKVAEAAGVMRGLARLLAPLLHRLFPQVPPAHPAMGAMVMNVSANVLGLSNAATPFGVRAMQGLNSLNPVKGTATDAMVLFLALNTANVTLLPTHVVALRTALGSHDPAAVIPTTLFATLWSTGFALAFAKWGNRRFPPESGAPAISGTALPAPAAPEAGEAAEPLEPYPRWVSLLALAAAAAILPLTLLWGRVISPWIIPTLLVAILGAGLARRVPIYERFVEGAKDGLAISFRIIPYLVAILVAVGIFQASGAMELLIGPLGRLTDAVGIPPQALTMAVLRSLSGSASFGYLASLLKDPAIGPDSYLGVLVSTIYGSSETTFYVLAVYFGAVGVRRIRHALLAGLLADLGGLVFSALICGWLYR